MGRGPDKGRCALNADQSALGSGKTPFSPAFSAGSRPILQPRLRPHARACYATRFTGGQPVSRAQRIRTTMAGSPPVAIIMGSQSDWATMRHAAETLEALQVAHEARIVSAHRTPDRLVAFAKGARDAGFKVVIAGAGGAAHLPGMTAAMTPLPVFGVPVESKALSGRTACSRSCRCPPASRSAHPRHRPGRRGQRRAACRRGAGPDRSRSRRPLDAWRTRQTEAVTERPDTTQP